MKSVLFTDESSAPPNDPDGLTKGWAFNGEKGNELLIGPFHVPEELKLPADTYCLFLKNSIKP